MLSVRPLFRNAFRMMGPCEWGTRLRLTHVLNGQSVMCGGAAVLIPLWAVPDVFKRAAIDQHLASVVADPKAECVGMAMTSTAGTERAGVNDDLAIGGVHHVQAGLSKS